MQLLEELTSNLEKGADNAMLCVYCWSTVGSYDDENITLRDVEVLRYYHSTMLRHCLYTSTDKANHSHRYDLTVTLRESSYEMRIIRVLNSQIFSSAKACMQISPGMGASDSFSESSKEDFVRDSRLNAPDITYKEVRNLLS